jgi:hypothetical protein
LSVGAVFLAALATAVVTSLGAIPFVFLAHPKRSSLGIANALAAGAMAGAGVGLVWEGWQRGPGRVLLGLAAGAVVIAARVAPIWTVALVGMLAAAAIVAFQASLL